MENVTKPSAQVVAYECPMQVRDLQYAITNTFIEQSLGPRLAPLRWHLSAGEKVYACCDTVLGSMMVQERENNASLGYCFTEYHDEDTLFYSDIDAAFAAAVKLYLERIAPALSEVE